MQIDDWGFKDLRLLGIEDLKTIVSHILTDNPQFHFNFPDVSHYKISNRVGQGGSPEVQANKDFVCILKQSKFWKIISFSLNPLSVCNEDTATGVHFRSKTMLGDQWKYFLCCRLDPDRALQVALFFFRLFI